MYVAPRIARAMTTATASVSATTNARCRHIPRGARANTMTPRVIDSDAMADAGKNHWPLVGATITGLWGGFSGNWMSLDVATRSVTPIATIATNRCRIRRNDTKTIAIPILSVMMPGLVANQFKNLEIDR